jgi:hypothetical protein
MADETNKPLTPRDRVNLERALRLQCLGPTEQEFIDTVSGWVRTYGGGKTNITSKQRNWLTDLAKRYLSIDRR